MKKAGWTYRDSRVNVSRRIGLLAGLGSALLVSAGCSRSQFIQASIENGSAQKLSVVEIDYPNASFGVSTLAPGANYSYRFKPQGAGTLQLSYTDGLGKAHTAAGPEVREDQGGRIAVRIGESGEPVWSAAR